MTRDREPSHNARDAITPLWAITDAVFEDRSYDFTGRAQLLNRALMDIRAMGYERHATPFPTLPRQGVSPRGAYPSRFTPMPLTGQALSEANDRL